MLYYFQSFEDSKIVKAVILVSITCDPLKEYKRVVRDATFDTAPGTSVIPCTDLYC